MKDLLSDKKTKWILVLFVLVYLFITTVSYNLWWQLLFAILITTGLVYLKAYLDKINSKTARWIAVFSIMSLLLAINAIDLHKDELSDDCIYSPFETVNGSAINLDPVYVPEYIDNGYFKGAYTFRSSTFQVWNETDDTVFTGGYVSDGLTEIYHVTIFKNFVYVSGENLWPNEDYPRDNHYFLYRYDMLNGFEEELLYNDMNYITVVSSDEYLIINRRLEDQGRTQLTYDTNFDLIDSKFSLQYNIKIIDFDDQFVLVSSSQSEKQYDLYTKDNEFIDTIGYFSIKRMHEENDQYYITSNSGWYDNFHVNVYDKEGTFIEKLEDYPLRHADDYLLYSDNYIIYNNADNFDDTFIWSTTVKNKRYKDVCELSQGVVIFEMNDKLYVNEKLDNKIFEVREKVYITPIKYNNTMLNLTFWTMGFVLSYHVAGTKKHFHKLKK